ncbi:hypothetical protein [Nocardioides sp. T2.26MG-1]|uniref:hypothetical protein n=1 Tax=Nocardioides sp. T2.26MG-1 TaxID=3041166 RepID=UPI0024777B08|nr:hypothetical protein [Nocardioides sp. T2.26MG-1]CAI9406325.1 hypothetical protein HIDPHFAB_04560 [Nocardioides sp. T2.26MG-1]
MNDTSLATALHDRVDDEWTDLDELVRVSTRAGTRIRRRRRAGVALAAAGAVAAVAVGVAMIGGSGDPTGASRHDPGLATDPSSAQSTRTDEQLQRPAQEARAHARALRMLERGPVYVDSADWRCDKPLDEKFSCSQGAASVIVNWRSADTWADYQDPDKADVLPHVHTFVSEVHGEFFATVQPAPGSTQAQVDQVGAALIWAA